MKRIVTVMIAAAILVSSVGVLSGCELRSTSPEDTYKSPLVRTNDIPASKENVEETYSSADRKKNDQEKSAEESSKDSESAGKKESKAESKTESKTDNKAQSTVQSKAESKSESKSESKAESKTEVSVSAGVESRTESKAESKAESKSESKNTKSEEDIAPIYKDMVGLIKDKDSNVEGYTVTKLPGSDYEHLIIAYGDPLKEEDTDLSNIIILDQEAFAAEQAEKEAARIEAREVTRMYSVYKIDGDRVVPEGDIDGYYTTAYTSPNTATPGLYYSKDNIWRYGLIEITDGSATVNYTSSGNAEDSDGVIPGMPGNPIEFSKPNKFDLIKKYRNK